MGSAGSATCRECGHSFSIVIGGGFEFQMFFCEDCGYGNSILHGRQLIPDLPDDPGCVGHCAATSHHILDSKRCNRNALKVRDISGPLQPFLHICRCTRNGRFTVPADH